MAGGGCAPRRSAAERREHDAAALRPAARGPGSESGAGGGGAGRPLPAPPRFARDAAAGGAPTALKQPEGR